MPNPSGTRNPLFNDNKFKIGTFATNTIGSWYTVAPEAYEPNWENSLRVAKLADRAGFEASLGLAPPVAKVEAAPVAEAPEEPVDEVDAETAPVDADADTDADSSTAWSAS